MNFKKALAILLVLSLFTALLTGCGLIKTDDDFETDANGNKITQTDKNGKETQKSREAPIATQTTAPQLLMKLLTIRA